MPREHIQFRQSYLEPELAEREGEGHSRDLVAKRDLARYYTMLEASLRRIELSEDEARLCCQALDLPVGIDDDRRDRTSQDRWQAARAEIEEAIRLNHIDKKYGVDGSSLLEYLSTLSPGEICALVDACERFWLIQEHRETADLLRELGLVRVSLRNH
jgi:hypothetical protein